MDLRRTFLNCSGNVRDIGKKGGVKLEAFEPSETKAASEVEAKVSKRVALVKKVLLEDGLDAV